MRSSNVVFRDQISTLYMNTLVTYALNSCSRIFREILFERPYWPFEQNFSLHIFICLPIFHQYSGIPPQYSANIIRNINSLWKSRIIWYNIELSFHGSLWINDQLHLHRASCSVTCSFVLRTFATIRKNATWRWQWALPVTAKAHFVLQYWTRAAWITTWHSLIHYKGAGRAAACPRPCV